MLYVPACSASWDLIALPSFAVLSLSLLSGYAIVNKVRHIRSGPGSGDDASPHNFTTPPPAAELFCNQLRLLCTVALFVLQLVTRQDVLVCFNVRFGYVLTAVYLYTALLAAYTVLRPNSATADVHLALCLLSVWFIFAYRDIWPLATYTSFPADDSEGWLLWAKLSVLTLGAVVIPLVRPRRYVPYDPKNPAANVNVEQTASIFSRVFYTYVDPFVFEACKVASLTTDELPPLCDTDDVKNLEDWTYQYLDPLRSGTNQHMFWRLLRAFFWEHVELLVLIVLMVLAYFASPIGVNRLLVYIETGGRDATMRPWFWALWIGVGQLSIALLSGRYMLIMTRHVARTQGILTQLIFDHTMHVRLHGSPEDKIPPASASTTDRADAPEEQHDADTLVGSSRAESDIITVGEDATRSNGKKSLSLGKLNNLVAADINNLEDGQYWILSCFFTPIQILVSIVFLYIVLGWSSFIGVVLLLVLLPIPGRVTKISHDIQAQKMKKSDARVETVTEVMSGAIRMVKMFGWETRMSERIDEKREEELILLRKNKLVNLVTTIMNRLIPILSMATTFVVYAVVMKQELTASRVFSSVTVFGYLQMHFRGWSDQLPGIISAKVSLDRISDFLHNTDMVEPIETVSPNRAPLNENVSVVGIRDAVFTWDSPHVALNRRFRLSIEGEMVFQRGKINLVIGQTGSGKTSLLMALLGEMHFKPTGPNAYVSLPRAGGVAFHAQESWILSETIRDNILFGLAYDEARYNEVIRQCALESDLALFKAGDMTEVGERGVTLSGGQKARVTLARAVYSYAEILILDDVFSALDAHTSRWIVNECLKGDLIQGRTLIIATHSVALISPVAHFVVALTPDGRISSQGTLESALEKDSALLVEETEDSVSVTEPKIELRTDKASDEASDGKLVAEEDILEGHVGWTSLQLFLKNMAATPQGLILFWVVFLLSSFIATTSTVMYTWVLGLWARQYELLEPSQVAVLFYVSLYMGVVGLNIFNIVVEQVVFTYGSLHAAKVIHRRLVDSTLRSTLRWLDRTPSSRIIARCTQDISTIEGPMSSYLWNLVDMVFIFVERFAAVIYMTPAFTLPSMAIGFVGTWVGQLYIKAQLPVKRELSNARAPILGHFGSAVAGLVSIRAYGAQQAFQLESIKRINRSIRAARTHSNLTKWISIRSETLAATFDGSLAAYLVYSKTIDASSIGFTLAMSSTFTNLTLWLMRYYNEFEVSGNSVERIQQYLDIEHEPSPTAAGKPPAYWPASGALTVEKLSARYSENGPKVLHDISFQVQSGERIGIVGRTGSGKSSLTLSLLRCIPTGGKVYFDGVPIDQINLDALRSAITIIPQVPELLSGTLRDNVDPFSEHDDAYLNDALRAAGLFSLDRDKFGERLTLDSSISSAGKNLSVGQRQMIALARALVRQSRLLILDEATSAIDYETDEIIQASLRKLVSKDVSLLTVAHRLRTIMDSDKIMVLDAGRVVEFGKPRDLLKDQSGILYSLVQASPDKDRLLAVVHEEGDSSVR